jgi:hypothetical protein
MEHWLASTHQHCTDQTIDFSGEFRQKIVFRVLARGTHGTQQFGVLSMVRLTIRFPK